MKTQICSHLHQCYYELVLEKEDIRSSSKQAVRLSIDKCKLMLHWYNLMLCNRIERLPLYDGSYASFGLCIFYRASQCIGCPIHALTSTSCSTTPLVDYELLLSHGYYQNTDKFIKAAISILSEELEMLLVLEDIEMEATCSR
jgi:hypothetical protein